MSRDGRIRRMSLIRRFGFCSVLAILFGNCASAQNAAGYTWANAYTGGGGGYIPNIIFNPSQQNLIYVPTLAARTGGIPPQTCGFH